MSAHVSALATLSNLHVRSCRVQRRGDVFRFRMRRTATDTLVDELTTLADLGHKCKVYNGGTILITRPDGTWASRRSRRNRGYTVVDVEFNW